MSFVFFFQAEDGIRDLVRSRGLGDVYKRQIVREQMAAESQERLQILMDKNSLGTLERDEANELCLLYTSDAADERSSVDLGGRRIIKKKKTEEHSRSR